MTLQAIRTEKPLVVQSTSSQLWYACRVMSRAEKKVAMYLEERGIDGFLPLMTMTRRWKDRQKRLEVPMFQGYVFARFPLARYGEILRVPRLSTVVRLNGAPAPVRDEEIENVRRFAERLSDGRGFELEPVHHFVEGQRVRILAEPFRGSVEGVVLQLRGIRRVRVFVGVSLVGQYLRITVGANDIEPISDGPGIPGACSVAPTSAARRSQRKA